MGNTFRQVFVDWLNALILGVIEGLTEFLPVSSTGHLILAEKLFHLPGSPEFKSAFEVVIQSGAVLAVLVLYFKRLWPFMGSSEEKKNKWKLWGMVFIAIIPAVVLGLLFDDFIEAKLFNPLTVSITLVFYGILFILTEIFLAKGKGASKEIGGITVRYALLIGAFQCLAMVPGTSRSGATILGALLLGFSRTAASEFSFFLALPTIGGASVLKLAKSGLSFTANEWGLLAVGAVAGFLTALVVIRAFISYLQKYDFKPFGVYRIALGALIIGLIATGVMK